MKFKIGVDFDIDTMDGKKIKTVCHFENPNKLIQDEKGGKGGKIIREFTDTELVAVSFNLNIFF